MPRLEVKSKSGSRTVPFSGPRITIGRQAGNDIIIEEAVASRRHCVIEQRLGAFRVVDLKSHNGTWLGENRILEASIGFGDSIRIGGTFIRLLPDEAERSEAEEEALPTAELVVEDEEPIVTDTAEPAAVRTRWAIPSEVRGPLSKQLAPLVEACANVPVPEGAPETPKDVRLLNRKLEPVTGGKDDQSRSGEAVDGFRRLLFTAFRTRATDIHIEPKGEVYAMRFRIDGLLHPVGEVTVKMGVAILNVIKVLCELDIAKKSIVQEGSFAVELPSRRVDFRISFTPTVYGQKLALRFLDKAAVPDQFENLGMDLDGVAELAKICEQDAGMVILAGPTGSGKTTTLYTALKTINAEQRNIVTIEDPVEYELPKTTQISIDPLHNLTFASVLASILRQDPDVILVGEIRDQETAKLAMQAATTGHLVLTTLHARDTTGTVFRLLDLGVEPFLIANAVSMCISQRLIRVLCPNCKRPYRPGTSLIRRMRLEARSHGMFYEAVGCQQCMSTGYRGRMALYEMLLFSPQVRDVILTNPTIAELRKAGGEWMFHTLQDSGYRRVIEGTTTIQEVDRVAGAA
jgi:type II secretory ATPase GspE/PulE/Tfp pilus assembly ATPase PilB-like protein